MIDYFKLYNYYKSLLILISKSASSKSTSFKNELSSKMISDKSLIYLKQSKNPFINNL